MSVSNFSIVENYLCCILYFKEFTQFEPRSDQTKDYNISMCCFSTKNAALMSQSNDWLARNQNNVSEWGDM
jgi:hypothetical protein